MSGIGNERARRSRWRAGCGTTLGLLLSIALGCTADNPSYCDEQTACGTENQVCDVARRRCVARDGGPAADGTLDDGGGRGLGVPCARPGNCASGHCVDGVCCESACDRACTSCALPVAKGRCNLAPIGEDPRGECAGVASACAGRCDGLGACDFPADDRGCGAVSCSAGVLSEGRCGGDGTCAAHETHCGGYGCDAAACRTRCDDASDCIGSFQCVAHGCVNDRPLGSDCGSNDQACASGHCADGRCCAVASCASCSACDVDGSGTCKPLPDDGVCGSAICSGATLSTPRCKAGSCQTIDEPCGPYRCSPVGDACLTACGDDDDCQSDHYCDASKQCVAKKQQGQGCGAANQCVTNACAQGVCCDRTCGGSGKPCEACDLSGKVGSCTFKPTGTVCGSPDLCVNDPTRFESYIEQHRCSGSTGDCPATSKPCNPYRCSGSACLTSCDAHKDCTTDVCDLFDGFGHKHSCRPADEICYAHAGGANGDGSQGSPHSAAQACLAKAPAYVHLADGSYAEALSVTADVGIVGAGSPSPGPLNGTTLTSKVVVQPPGTQVGLTANGALTVGLWGVAVTHGSSGVGSLLLGLAGSANLELITSALLITAGRCLDSTSSGTLTLRDVGLYACGEDGLHVEGAQELRIVGSSQLNINGVGVYHSGGKLTVDDLHQIDASVGLQTYNSTLAIDRLQIESANKALRLENGTTGVITNLVAAGALNGIQLANNSGPIVFGNATVLGPVLASGALVECDGSATFVNSIVRDSQPRSFPGCKFDHSNVNYSGGGLPPGAGNINANPVVTGSRDTPTLGAASPCIDAGDDSGGGLYALPPTDLAGNARRVDNHSGVAGDVDMGAYEYTTPID